MGETGEGSSSGPQFSGQHGPLTQNFQSSATSVAPITSLPVEVPDIDTPMDDTVMSDFSSNTEHDPSEYGDTVDISDRCILTAIDMGEAIEYAFPVTMEYDNAYDITDQRHIFDDGLSDDETSYSDASTNYEELTEPDIVEHAVPGPRETILDGREDRSELDEVESEDEFDEAYEFSASENDENIINTAEKPPSVIPELPEQPSGIKPAQAPEPARKTLDELQNDDILPKKNEEMRDQEIWQLRELQEVLRQVELKIPVTEAKLDEAERTINIKQQSNAAALEASGLTMQIFQEYNMFCESLQPEYGLRDGFSIECNQPHRGSYIDYDPGFQIFKDCVEIDHSTFNWRCEASGTGYVEFWPIKCPEPVAGGFQTWGNHYPNLYRLVNDAVIKGSKTAREMLTRLPDMNAACDGGWLFDYEFRVLLKDEPIISRRWTFRGANFLGRPINDA